MEERLLRLVLTFIDQYAILITVKITIINILTHDYWDVTPSVCQFVEDK